MIAIYEDQGENLTPDDFEPTALYHDGEWLAGGDEWEPYYPAGIDEAVLASQLDGPSPVAVEIDDPDAFLANVEKDQLGPPMSQTMGVGSQVQTIDERDNDDADPSDEDDEDDPEHTQSDLGGTYEP